MLAELLLFQMVFLLGFTPSTWQNINIYTITKRMPAVQPCSSLQFYYIMQLHLKNSTYFGSPGKKASIPNAPGFSSFLGPFV